MADFLCKNSDLTNRGKTGGGLGYSWGIRFGNAKKQENFLKLGVDFAGQTRYNVCLYGKLEEGGAIHAQH